MDDIVAVKVDRQGFASAYLLTWGRIQDPVKPDPLLAVVKSVLGRFGLDGDVAIALCSINEASSEPHFYEAFFSMCQTPIPYGDFYQSWRSKMAIRMAEGEDIYLVSGVS